MASPRGPIPELHLIGVADAGVVNLERVVLRPTQPLSLNGYGIAVGVGADGEGAYPVYDNCYWFPEITVSPPSWIIVFTGKGSWNTGRWHTGEDVTYLHWQRQFTVFNAPNLLPVLFRVDGAVVSSQL